MVGARTGVSASAAARSSARCLRRLRPRRARLAVVRLALGAAVVVVGAIAVTVRGSGAPVKRAGAGAREVAQRRQCRMQAVGMGHDGMQGGVLSLGSVGRWRLPRRALPSFHPPPRPHSLTSFLLPDHYPPLSLPASPNSHQQHCSTLLTITALFVNGDSWVDVGNNHDGSHRFLRADLPLYGMSYIEALERFSDGRLKIDYLARYLGLPSPPPVLQQGRNASRGLYFSRAESHTLDHRLLDAIHGSEGGYIVGAGRASSADGGVRRASLIKYPPLEEVRGLPEEIVGDEEDMDFADVDASVEGEEDEDDGV
ncbi:unnamed protein product [Closterium sp. Naga37s-1]|nr:unnamed protein product [Closterium sp. Naga37s-1]